MFAVIKNVSDSGLEEIIDGFTPLLLLITIHRKNNSTWLGYDLRPPVVSFKYDRSVSFPSKSKPVLETFHLQVLREMEANNTAANQLNKTTVINMTRLYQIESNTPYLAQFWSEASNAQFRFLSADIKV